SNSHALPYQTASHSARWSKPPILPYLPGPPGGCLGLGKGRAPGMGSQRSQHLRDPPSSRQWARKSQSTMNEPIALEGTLPGLPTLRCETVPTQSGNAPAAPRLKPVDRTQLSWQMLDVERLIEPEHPARAIWELVGQLKLEGFYAPIQARQGAC